MVNQDFTKRIAIDSAKETWHKSPSDGVERLYLERDDGGESAVATSIVRFAPGSKFDKHIHDGGEEFIVLEGTFSDEFGSYPKGTYVRNPQGSAHNPFSDSGCKLFVKLRQFQNDDQEQIKIDTNKEPWLPGLVDGLSVMPLHHFNTEHAALVKWAPNTVFNPHQHWGGEEILVLEGTFYDEFGTYPKGSWLRSPHLSQHTPFTKEEGALIFVKTGHLN
jgi:anti-sigma factor ChrR (cupin superfamily)|tara:strand:+ start:956 stop:1612 length:657 start_codon:yes stop_codon:yes gene_type:complete